jgi:hypothetical protein
MDTNAREDGNCGKKNRGQSFPIRPIDFGSVSALAPLLSLADRLLDFFLLEIGTENLANRRLKDVGKNRLNSRIKFW